MSPLSVVVLLLAGLLLAGSPPPRRPRPVVHDVVPGGRSSSADPAPDAGLLRRARLLWAVLAGLGAAVVLGGPLAPLAGVAAGAGVLVAATRIEPPGVRRRREAVRRDLPYVVTLLAAALRSGAAPVEALELVHRALPGPAAEVLGDVARRLRLGADPAQVWGDLARDVGLGPLGRSLARAHRTGAPVVAAVERLGLDLAAQARADVEDRARAVGVRAAVPLGVCLLPAFVLLGIVPLAVSLADGLI